jgi:nitric oxide reductase NorD protein
MTPAVSTALAGMLAALRGRPELEVDARQAANAISAQDDAPSAQRWSEGVLALLHTNAGAACLTKFLHLRGRADVLADLAGDVADICRHAGAMAAIACINAWEPLRASSLGPALRGLAREAPDCAVAAAANAGAIIRAVGSEGFASFVALGLKGAGRDKVRRAAFFALTDPLAQRALASGIGGGFAVHERGLKLFATALWGRAPKLRPLPLTPGRPPARRFSLSDGVLLLPETFPGVPRIGQAALFRACVAHGLAHLIAGTPRKKVGQLKPLQLAVIGVIEDARVETLALHRFPGLRRLWAPYHVAQPEGVTAPALIARLARALFDPAYADPHGFVAKGRSLFADADLRDSNVSRRIGGLLGNDLGQMRVQFNSRDYVVEPAYRDDGLGLWDFGEQFEVTRDVLDMLVEAARLRQEDGDGRLDPQQNKETGGGRARVTPAEPESVFLASYPEWDRMEGMERPGWTTVRAVPAPLGDVRRLNDAIDAMSDLRRRINQLVRSARPGRPRHVRRQRDGAELDMDAVLDAQVAQVAGELPDDRLYRATSLQTRDLATVVLIDVSESTRFGNVLEVERVAIALLAEAMDGLGDPFALMAFASDGREQVRLTSIKSFADPFAQPARMRLAGLSPGLSTRLGAALRHAGAELGSVRSFRRMVLVLTDGEPSDIDVTDPQDLVEDTRRAVLGLRARGIDAFAIVLGAGGAETAARMFGRSGHVVLRRMEDLPARLSDLYFRLSRR